MHGNIFSRILLKIHIHDFMKYDLGKIATEVMWKFIKEKYAFWGFCLCMFSLSILLRERNLTCLLEKCTDSNSITRHWKLHLHSSEYMLENEIIHKTNVDFDRYIMYKLLYIQHLYKKIEVYYNLPWNKENIPSQ